MTVTVVTVTLTVALAAPTTITATVVTRVITTARKQSYWRYNVADMIHKL
jgi:hypothetical protein